MLKLHDIHVSKLRASGLFSNDNEMFELSEYDQMARSIIFYYCTPDFAKYMVSNPEALSYIVECLMFGSCKWDKTRKSTTHRGYLSRCGQWAIVRWWCLLQKQSTTMEVSLYDHCGAGDDTLLIENLVDNKYDQSLKTEAIRECVANLIVQTPLTDRQQECVTSVYINGESQADVARRLKVSREAIGQSLKQSIRKIQHYAKI